MSNIHSVIVPAGTYFLGDPCYVVRDELWMDLLTNCDYFAQPTGKVEYNTVEYTVFAFSTAYGDGIYTGSNGFEYSVDAGLIGLTPIGLCDNANLKSGTVISFDQPTRCTNEDGDMCFGNIYINTSSYDYDEE